MLASLRAPLPALLEPRNIPSDCRLSSPGRTNCCILTVSRIANHFSRHLSPRPDLESRACEAHQRSIFLRLSGNISDSENMILGFLSELRGAEPPSDKLAALHLSQAGNHMYNFRFDNAHEEIKRAMSLSDAQQDRLSGYWSPRSRPHPHCLGPGSPDARRGSFRLAECLELEQVLHPR